MLNKYLAKWFQMNFICLYSYFKKKLTKRYCKQQFKVCLSWYMHWFLGLCSHYPFPGFMDYFLSLDHTCTLYVSYSYIRSKKEIDQRKPTKLLFETNVFNSFIAFLNFSKESKEYLFVFLLHIDRILSLKWNPKEFSKDIKIEQLLHIRGFVLKIIHCQYILPAA